MTDGPIRLYAGRRECRVGKTPKPEGWASNTGDVRVFVDRVEVTKRCFAASEAEGFAACYVEDEDGGFLIDPVTEKLARVVLTGKVECFNVSELDTPAPSSIAS